MKIIQILSFVLAFIALSSANAVEEPTSNLRGLTFKGKYSLFSWSTYSSKFSSYKLRCICKIYPKSKYCGGGSPAPVPAPTPKYEPPTLPPPVPAPTPKHEPPTLPVCTQDKVGECGGCVCPFPAHVGEHVQCLDSLEDCFCPSNDHYRDGNC